MEREYNPTSLSHTAIQHSAQDESALNRARYKIEEAIDRGNLAHLVTKDSIVIDLGAAPGGWSAYLA